MQVFTEFIKSDLTEDQILPVLRDLLPVLLHILGSTQVSNEVYQTKYTSNVSITPGPFSTHPSAHGLSLPSMRHGPIYG
jgi:hypothetical protein